MKARNFYTSLLLLLAIILFVNLLVGQLLVRLDLTEDKQFTLSDATRNIIEDLDRQLSVQVYFSEDLPPDIEKVQRDFQELLIEYENLSKGMISYTFINPAKEPELEQEAMESGIRPIMINVREKDQVKQQKAYMGAVLQMGEGREIIPFIQPGMSMEYALSSSIKKHSITDKPVVGFLQGHGEATTADMQQVMAGLQVMYRVEEVEITDTSGIPGYINTLAVIRPEDSIPGPHLRELQQFLFRGGRLFLAYNQVEGKFDTGMPMGEVVQTGVTPWLKGFGLEVRPEFLVDASCGTVNVQQQQGLFTYSRRVQFPYLPVLKNFPEHPVNQGLEAMVMEFASPLIYTGDTTSAFQPLLTSSETADVQEAPLYFDVQKNWTKDDFARSGIIIGGIVDMDKDNDASGRMIVVTDGDFPVGGTGNNARQVQEDNVNFMVNAIDWLSDDTGLIELRTKGTTYRPLKDLEDGKKTFLKWLNFLLPVLLVIMYGFYRWQRNRMTRIKRMEDRYE